MKIVIESYDGWKTNGENVPSKVIEVEVGDTFEADDSYYWFRVREIKP